jgi:hypothetical protein
MPGAWSGGAGHGLLRAALLSAACWHSAAGVPQHPSLAVKPIMQLATKRLLLLLLCVTSRGKGPCSIPGACPCTALAAWRTQLATFWSAPADLTTCGALPCSSGCSRNPAGGRRAGRHAGAVPAQTEHFAELANFLVLAKRRWFALDGARRCRLVAGGTGAGGAESLAAAGDSANSVYFGPSPPQPCQRRTHQAWLAIIAPSGP